jgi:Ca2+-binding EF-hand superfamily protein
MGGGGTKSFVVNDQIDGQGEEIMALKKQIKLSDSELNKYWAAFCKVDKMYTGSIHIEQFHKYYQLEETPFTMKVFSIMDTDANGGINFHEFILAIWNYLSLDMNSLATFSFRLFDTDNSKLMEKGEVEAMISCVYGGVGSNERVQKVLDKMQPANGDSITSTEFVNYSRQYPLLLYPAFAMQNVLRRHIFGEGYWNAVSADRAKNMADKTIFDILEEESKKEKSKGRDTPKEYFKEMQSRQEGLT